MGFGFGCRRRGGRKGKAFAGNFYEGDRLAFGTCHLPYLAGGLIEKKGVAGEAVAGGAVFGRGGDGEALRVGGCDGWRVIFWRRAIYEEAVVEGAEGCEGKNSCGEGDDAGPYPSENDWPLAGRECFDAAVLLAHIGVVEVVDQSGETEGAAEDRDAEADPGDGQQDRQVREGWCCAAYDFFDEAYREDQSAAGDGDDGFEVFLDEVIGFESGLKKLVA